jgi:hypothetical protein
VPKSQADRERVAVAPAEDPPWYDSHEEHAGAIIDDLYPSSWARKTIAAELRRTAERASAEGEARGEARGLERALSVFPDLQASLPLPKWRTEYACGKEEAWSAAEQAIRALRPTQAEPKTFEEVWAEKEKEGYRYGESALEQVRFGWDLACGFRSLSPTPAEPARSYEDGVRDGLEMAADALADPRMVGFSSRAGSREVAKVVDAELIAAIRALKAVPRG